MEPLAALSVASSVIAFVDYGGKILSNAEQIYRSYRGAPQSVVNLEDITNDIEKLIEGLRRNLPQFRKISEIRKEDITDDDALDQLCISCHKMANLLLARIKKLQPEARDEPAAKAGKELDLGNAAPELGAISSRRPLQIGHGGSKEDEVNTNRKFSKWSSFKSALALSWNKREMEGMAAELKEFRGQIEFRILISIRQSLNETAVHQSSALKEISRSTQEILGSFLSARDELADLLRLQATRIITAQEEQLRRPTVGIQRQTEVTHGKIEEGGLLYQSRAEVSSSFQPASFAQEAQLEEELRILVTENDILSNLSFATLDDRRESIDLPHVETFEWIYKEPVLGDRRWNNFVKWLRIGQGIYWINGKVGSGKSTLMRYIFENPKTMENFEAGAKNMPAKVYGFFFWRSGDEEQRS